jgi:hypothetical protein
MWYDADGRGPEGAPGCAYATACLRAAPTPEAARWIRAVSGRRGGPPWIYGRGGAGRLCALGISGPTLEPAAARVHAEEAGRAELAAAIALRARTATAIFDAEEILFGAVTLPCAPCAEAARHGQVAASWQDERGEGPLPFPGTAYALLCTDP